MPEQTKRGLTVLGLLLALACWASVFVSVWNKPGADQWDLNAYGVARVAYDQGLNPYVKADIARVAPGRHILPFVYPLSSMAVFKPIASSNYLTAHRAWLVVKLAAVVALLVVWKFAFLRDTSWLWLLVVGLFAFHAAMIWDIKSGNVNAIEQLLLWSGFACLAKRKLVAFAALVTASAFFKLVPAVFLLLLLWPSVRRKHSVAIIAASILALAAVTAFSFKDHPDYFRSFLKAAAMTPGGVQFNPCAFGLATELGRRFPQTFLSSPVVTYGLWLLFSAGVLFAGRRLIADAWRSPSVAHAIMVACFCYALVAPRFMIYSYVLLVVPVLALVVPAARRSAAGAIALAGLLCIEGLHLLPGETGKLLQDSGPFLLMLACWLFLAYARAKNALRPAEAA
jgi:hypothetical protein